MEIDAAVDRSVEVSDLLDSLAEVGDHFISWADRRQKLLAGYRRDLRRLRAVADELSDEWHELAEVQVAGMELMRRPAMVRKYLAQHREDLTREQRALFREFMRRPWFWTLFSVAEQVRGDVYRVVDHLSDCANDCSIHRHSPTCIARASGCSSPRRIRMGCAVRPSEWFTTTAAYSPTTSPISPRRCVPISSGRRDWRRPWPRGRPTSSCWRAGRRFRRRSSASSPIRWDAHEVTVRSFSVERYAADFEISVVPERPQVFEGRLRDRDTPFELATFYYDAVKGVLTAVTAGQDLYRELALLLREQAELPDDPDWSAQHDHGAGWRGAARRGDADHQGPRVSAAGG